MEPQHRNHWLLLARQSFDLPGGAHLRAVRPTDAEALLASVDDQVSRWLLSGHEFSRADAERLSTILAPRLSDEGGGAMWAIADACDLLCGLASVNLEPDGVAALGLWLGPQARNRGLASAALRSVAAAVMEQTPADGLAWRCLVGNVAALRAARAAGFSARGTWPAPVGPERELRPTWWAMRSRDREPQPHPWAECLVEIAAGRWQLQPMDATSALLAEEVLPLSACVPTGVWVAREITTARADAVVALLTHGDTAWVLAQPAATTPTAQEAAAEGREVIARYARLALGLTTP